MATQTIKTTFQFKRGNADAWEKSNPILAPGEPGWTLDTHVFKIGDGVTPWNDLEAIKEEDYEKYVTHEELEKLVQDISIATKASKEYDIVGTPDGTLVSIKESEIRIMCPSNTKWLKQNSGANADKNKFYIGFKAYAPDKDILAFKEDLSEIITDQTLYTFEGNEFAGIEPDGRKYSIVWLPVANYDEESDSWTYYGAKSTTKKFIGWVYSVEWYNKELKRVASSSIRINLSNEDCHNFIEPYFMGSINANRIVQDDVLVLYGGSASDNI